MSEQKKNILETGSFTTLLCKLSLPAVIVILIMIVYNLADTFFIGQTGSADKIAAVSVCMPVFTILSGLGTLFGIGGSTSISIALGEKNTSRVSQISTFCTFGCLILGLGSTVLMYLFAPQVCMLLGASESVLEDAIVYLRIFSFAGPFVLFSNTYGNVLRSDGEAVSPMAANILGTLANIVLDALFILVFHWDVAGAAWATVIGNMLATGAMLFILMAKKQHFMSHFKTLTLRKDITFPVLTLGLPMTFSTVLSSVSGAMQNRLMITYGTYALAAQSVAGKMGMVITMLIMGLCMGMQPAISFNYGSRNYSRMYDIVKKLNLFSLIIGSVLAILVFLFRNQMVTAFIDDERVIALGGVFVIASVCMAPLYAVYQVCQVFFQSTGNVRYAIFSSLLDKGLVFIPVLFCMNLLFGSYGIAFSHLVTMVISAGVTLVLYRIWTKRIAHHAV